MILPARGFHPSTNKSQKREPAAKSFTYMSRHPLLTSGRAIGRFYRYWVIESAGHLRRGGPRELIRQRGWRFVIVIASYYLVRDSILYIILPLLVARGILSS